MTARAKRRILRWPSVVIALLLAGAAAIYLARPAPPIRVEVTRVARGTVRELVPSAAAGEVKAARRVLVRAELAGTVTHVALRAGDRVEAGAALVTLASEDLEAREAQARANLDASKVALAGAKLRLEATARTLDRTRKLEAKRAISPVDLERVETEHQAAEQAVDQAGAAIKQAQAAVDLARVAKRRTVVEAPFAGVLQEVMVEVGVQVVPSAPLFDLIDDSSVHLEIPIDEADIGRVHVGQTVLLHAGGRREDALTGKVTLIPPAVGRSGSAGMLEAAPQLAQRDRAIFVRAVPDDLSKFRVGAAVNAELLVSERADVLWVPTHVVMGRGRDREVFKVDGDHARRSRFTAGLTSWERTEVASGLAEGDVVVSSLDVKGLDDGVRVAVGLAAPGKGE